MQNLYRHPFPPQNYIAEEILLGIILIYPKIFYYIIPIIKIDYFFLECHQIIYIYLIESFKVNNLNLIDFLSHLSKTKILYKIGGIYKILNIMKQSQIFIESSDINIYTKELITLINQNYIKRLMIQYGHNIIKLGYIKNISTNKLYHKASYYLNYTENQIFQEKNIKNIKELISELMIDITKYKNNTNQYEIIKNKKLIKLESGFIELDRITSGLPKGDLIIIAGRPSMGKTSFAINIAYNIISQSKSGICIFSLEMSSKQILYKFISISCNISTQEINNYSLNSDKWHKIKNTCQQLSNYNIYINDTTNISINYIEHTAKLLIKEKKHINLIIIDYLQLIQGKINQNINRNQELSYITRRLKLLAQYLNIPIIVLSQLNRNIETRANKTPLLSDLKESGCINHKNNMEIETSPINSIYLINIKKILKKYISIKTIYNINNILKRETRFNKKYLKTKIYIFMQYVFNCYYANYRILSMTHNHKCLDNYKWKKNNSIIDNSIIIKTINNKNHFNTLYNTYITKVLFSNYSKSYDINTQNYYNFISNNIILHNSIEQDADIVMILFEIKQEENELKKSKILDIIVCKNRNGPTGSCELLFKPETTVFNNIELLDIIN
uniref:DNA 5'-3' helicase n=1 Tax=Acrosorium ciliolatum TaxID=1550622 RepID=A0A1Z1M1X4_9FLOR|nr:Replication helicase subunit [Acrosorium ciliolatum]ARW60078.1 Replication helicase subunit [Acrosorium ciliolatum]